MSTTFRFTALDTWFFRESRPMEALGGSELSSVFPPPPRTLLGAIRSCVGDTSGVDWQEYAKNTNHPLRQSIGYGDELGPLSISSGPWLGWKREQVYERLYPVPLNLLATSAGKDTLFARLIIGDHAETYLGKVRLPLSSKDEKGYKQGYKALEQAWLSAAGLQEVLNGGTPSADQLFRAKQLFEEEPRLGIARDNDKRTVQKSLLYQTRHVRPKRNLAVDLEIGGLPAAVMPPSGLSRLGGEGRLAHLEVVNSSSLPQKPTADNNTHGLILTLMTAARFGAGDNGWLFPGFEKQEENGFRVWKGRIEGIDLTLHAAVIGKAQREGGWNLAERKPRDVQSLIPAGSCYYCTVDKGHIAVALDALHDKAIGEDTKLGRGHIVCGLWNADEFKSEGKNND